MEKDFPTNQDFATPSFPVNSQLVIRNSQFIGCLCSEISTKITPPKMRNVKREILILNFLQAQIRLAGLVILAFRYVFASYPITDLRFLFFIPGSEYAV